MEEILGIHQSLSDCFQRVAGYVSVTYPSTPRSFPQLSYEI